MTAQRTGDAFTFDLDGFLSPRCKTLETALEAQHRKSFTKAYEINRDCHVLLPQNVPADPDHLRCMLVFFIRAVEHYQATVILLHRGIIAPAKVTFRALIETVFKVRALALDPESALQTLKDEDARERSNFIKKIEKHDYGNLTMAKESLSGDCVDEFSIPGGKRTSIEQWSELAKMHQWYIEWYPLLSRSTHSQAGDLDTMFTIDHNRGITSINYPTIIDGIELYLLNAMHCMVIAAAAASHFLESDRRRPWDEYFRFIKKSLSDLNPT